MTKCNACGKSFRACLISARGYCVGCDSLLLPINRALAVGPPLQDWRTVLGCRDSDGFASRDAKVSAGKRQAQL